MNLLIRLFIKDYKNITDAKVRERYGIFAGSLGIVCNILLFIAKFIAGTVSGSVSICADAFNNLSDAGSSVITIFGFKIAGKPADYEHPYGHGRYEYIAGLAISAAVIVMGVDILKTSFDKIIHPEKIELGMISFTILVCSIIVKMWMAFVYGRIGKKIDSFAMKATATDSLSDCISTTVVLISLLIGKVSDYNIDGYAGIIVAAFVIMAGIGAAKEVLQPLLGQAPKKELVDEIQKLVLMDDHIIGIHDLIVHDYGPGRIFASLHAEVPYKMDVMEAHDCVDLAEQRIMNKLGCAVSIHMDPVINDDDYLTGIKHMLESILKEVDPIIKMHDLRITKGPLIVNIIFDVLVPFEFRYTDAELVEVIKAKITAVDKKYKAVINIDKDYIGGSLNEDRN